MAAAMVMGHGPIRVAWHLISITLRVDGAAAGESSVRNFFLRADGRRRNQRRRHQAEKDEPGAAKHASAYQMARCLPLRKRTNFYRWKISRKQSKLWPRQAFW